MSFSREFCAHIEYVDCSRLVPYERNARTHSAQQISQIALSIERFGFTNPVLISEDLGIIAGHGRVVAAQQLGISQVPTIKLSHLTEADRRAYIIADNKLAENAGWDKDILAIEYQALIDLDYDIEVIGFDAVEIDLFMHVEDKGRHDKANQVPAVSSSSVSKYGDIWILGKHRLACGDARSLDDITALVHGDVPEMMFTDPPYNVPIQGHVSGLGKYQHKEFCFASGEMNRDDFICFLRSTIGNGAQVLQDGSISYIRLLQKG